MATLKEFRDKLSRLIADYDSVINKVIDDNSEAYADMNANEQQFNMGLLSTGSPIVPFYKDFTIKVKKRKNQPIDRVTLEDTGAFHKSFYAELKNDKLIIDAKDEKRSELVKKYGKDIFGLIPDLRRRVSREMVLPDLQKTLRTKLLTK